MRFRVFRLLFSVFFVFCMIAAPLYAEAMSTEQAQEAREAFINYAKQFVGVPYVYGGTDRNGIDCSGLVYVSAKEAVNRGLPRSASDLYSYVRIIPDARKEPGDLLFFRTVDTRISHVAIYIGNGQFIHAISDGPNTGVILSSLSERYWKEKYCAAGQFLPPVKYAGVPEEPVLENKTASSSGSKKSGTQKTNSSFSGKKGGSARFLDNLETDCSASLDWNFFSRSSFLLSIRGASMQIATRYVSSSVWPGAGLQVKWDNSLGIVQIPITFSISSGRNLRFYAGPVITICDPVIAGSDKKILPSVFPGILGASWQSNPLKAGKCGICFMQDISYTVFNDETNAALSIMNAITAGLCFNTGVRVILPL